MTLEECLAMMPPIWAEIERTVLEHVAAQAIADGFDQDAVRHVIENLAHQLRAGHANRLETAAAMLRARATSLQ
jgi:hypothetical protein